MHDTGSKRGHERCGAKTRSGKPCRNPQGFRTDHPGAGTCFLHLGATETHKRHAQVELARQACQTLGIPIEIHPAEALIEEVFRARGNVDFYERLVMNLPTHPEPDRYTPGEDGEDGRWERGNPGVYGRTYHQSGIPTGEGQPHVLVRLYNQERDRLRAASVEALKAGVEAAQLKLAEQHAALMAEGFHNLAVALGHDPASPEVREAFRAQLTALAARSAAA